MSGTAGIIVTHTNRVNLGQTGMDNIRGIVGCPVAGPTPNELFNASGVFRKYNDIFVGNREFTNLPRKFNVTITGCLDNCTHAVTQDLALTPVDRPGA